MKIAIALTLFFAAATSLLGAWRNFELATATKQRRYWTSVTVGIIVAAWMAFCGTWLLTG